MMNGGDILARGAKSATFPSSSHILQDKWDMAFKDFHPASEKPTQETEKETVKTNGE